ncbi:hypothetical protein TARUN_761 [Trichoderma arundinaceum]|uniref:Uncharacterized protein n=1 Tax=Trichoderma arundinaceum TaxID=490622 RepID=A0A395NZH4_TRIAR|nr:hypothetical protein TARUN_761 [Trichoderma arundinaceum]
MGMSMPVAIGVLVIHNVEFRVHGINTTGYLRPPFFQAKIQIQAAMSSTAVRQWQCHKAEPSQAKEAFPSSAVLSFSPSEPALTEFPCASGPTPKRPQLKPSFGEEAPINCRRFIPCPLRCSGSIPYSGQERFSVAKQRPAGSQFGARAAGKRILGLPTRAPMRGSSQTPDGPHALPSPEPPCRPSRAQKQTPAPSSALASKLMARVLKPKQKYPDVPPNRPLPQHGHSLVLVRGIWYRHCSSSMPAVAVLVPLALLLARPLETYFTARLPSPLKDQH